MTIQKPDLAGFKGTFTFTLPEKIDPVIQERLYEAVQNYLDKQTMEVTKALAVVDQKLYERLFKHKMQGLTRRLLKSQDAKDDEAKDAEFLAESR